MLGHGSVPVFGNPSFLAPPSQVYVPVTARGTCVVDNGGDVIATCFTPDLATQIAALLNRDAGLA